MKVCLTGALQFCSRIVEAESPMAIVIPSRGSGLSIKLRDGDISWHEFLESVRDFKYAILFHPDILFSSFKLPSM